MGIFDFLGGKKDKDATAAAPAKKSAREMARLAKLVGTKMTQNYDRQEALEALAEMGTREAATILLTRFSFTMDPSITDQEEKEVALRGITKAATDALDPIRAYCKKAESLTWAIKALESIVPPAEYENELLTVLDQFDTEYVRNPEPKIQLVTLLENHAGDEVRVAIEPFLEDAHEPVRFHAAGTVFSMNDEASIPALVAALAHEESLRVKNRIAEGLADRRWVVLEDLLATCSDALPRGFRIESGRVTGSPAG